MKKEIMFFSAVLLIGAIGALAFTQFSTAAIASSGNELAKDKCAVTSMNFEEEGFECQKKPKEGDTCAAAGDTYCDPTTKPGQFTCGCVGAPPVCEWGPRTACPAGQLCDISGDGGKCTP